MVKGICSDRKAVTVMLDLHDREWKDFRLLDYFRHEKGNQNNMAELRPGAFPLVSARNANNGYKDFVSENEKKHSFEGFCLTINNDGDGGAGISYYQPCKMLLDSHVTALYPKASMTEEILKFFSACITAQREKFGHEKILDSSTEYCICAEFCACDWNDWRVHFATTGVLHNHG